MSSSSAAIFIPDSSPPTILFSDDTTTDGPSLNTVGQRSQCFQWTKDQHHQFLTWWLQTDWVATTVGLNNADVVKQLGWDTTKRSVHWQQFYQAANRHTGEPAVVCQKCSIILAHPNSRVPATGTTTLGKHLTSKQCVNVSTSRSQGLRRQLSLHEAVPSSTTVSTTD
jgi:hypothetical protein